MSSSSFLLGHWHFPVFIVLKLSSYALIYGLIYIVSLKVMWGTLSSFVGCILWTEGNGQVWQEIGILQEVNPQTRKPNKIILQFWSLFFWCHECAVCYWCVLQFFQFEVWHILFYLLFSLLEDLKGRHRDGVGAFHEFALLISFIFLNV